MASLGDFFLNAPGKAYDYLGKPQAPAFLGDMAGRVMGNSEGAFSDIVRAVGGGAADMARSGIAAEKAKEQEAQNAMFRKLLMSYMSGGGGGGGAGGPTRTPVPNQGVPNELRTSPSSLTDKNLKGPTSTTMKKNADGTYTKTEIGRERDITQPVQAPQSPKGGGSNLLPLLLAQSGGGSSLAGLNPEQILGFMQRGNQAQRVGNQTFSALYNALQKEAHAGYMDRMPQERAGVKGPDLVEYQGHMIRRQDLPSMINALKGANVHSVEVGQDGFYHTIDEEGVTKKTDIPVPEKTLTRAPTAASKPTERTFANKETGLDEVWLTDAEGSKTKYLRTKEMSPEQFMSSMKDMKDLKSVDKSRFWNKNVRGSGTTAWAYKEISPGSESILGTDTNKRFELPMFKGSQMTMDNVREVAREENKTVDQIVLEIYNKVEELEKK